MDKLTIQPTTMNAIISGKKGWYIEFPRNKDTAPYLKDDKGNVFLYDPSGPVLMLEEGLAHIPADKQEKYKISMLRANDTIVVNKDFAIPLNR